MTPQTREDTERDGRAAAGGTHAHGAAERGEWFATEVEALLPSLFATAVHLTRDPADAEDLVEDALVKAWSRLSSLRDPSALEAWLCRIVTNTFLNQRRAQGARPPVESYEEEGIEDGGFSLFERLHQPFLLWRTNPERDFLNRLLRDDLARAIDALPDVFRVTVLLVDVRGFSYREASQTLDVPIGTVRSRLARGRSLLQEKLWRHAMENGLTGPAKEGA